VRGPVDCVFVLGERLVTAHTVFHACGKCVEYNGYDVNVPGECNTHTYIHTHVEYIHTYIHTHVEYIHLTYICTYILTYVRTYIHTHILHIHTCIHTYIHTYIHT
jgi:hypothetical protein